MITQPYRKVNTQSKILLTSSVVPSDIFTLNYLGICHLNKKSKSVAKIATIRTITNRAITAITAKRDNTQLKQETMKVYLLSYSPLKMLLVHGMDLAVVHAQV